MENFEALRDEWTKAGQGHVFAFWKDLTSHERDILCKQAQVCDVVAPHATSVVGRLSPMQPLLTSALFFFPSFKSIDVNMVMQVYKKLSQKSTNGEYA